MVTMYLRCCALYDWALETSAPAAPGDPGQPTVDTTQGRSGRGECNAIQRSYCGQMSHSGQETWANTSDDVIPVHCFDARIKTLYGGCVSVMESLIERPALAFHDPARLTGALDVRLLDVITGRQNLLMAINNHQITSIAHILASSAHNAAHSHTGGMLWPMLWWGNVQILRDSPLTTHPGAPPGSMSEC